MRPTAVSRSASPKPVMLRIMNAPSVPEIPLDAVEDARTGNQTSSHFRATLAHDVLKAAEQTHIDDANLEIRINEIIGGQDTVRHEHSPAVHQLDAAVQLEIATAQRRAVMLRAQPPQPGRHVQA